MAKPASKKPAVKKAPAKKVAAKKAAPPKKAAAKKAAAPKKGSECKYKLVYWGGKFAGRGQCIRMLLALTGKKWEDTIRGTEWSGRPQTFLKEHGFTSFPILFPPILIDCSNKDFITNQLANCLQYIGEREGLAGANIQERAHAMQIAMAYQDLIQEAIYAWHPVELYATAVSQAKEAAPVIAKFLEKRAPDYFAYFENCLRTNKGGKGYMIGKKISFADVAMLCMLRGYKGSSPQDYAKNKKIPLLKGLEKRLSKEPKLKAFEKSGQSVDIWTDSFI